MKKFLSLLVATTLIATSASSQYSYTADAANSKVVSVGAKSKKAIEAKKSTMKTVGEFLKEHKKAVITVVGELSWNVFNLVKHYDEIAKIVFDGNLSVKEKIAKVSKIIFCGIPKTVKEKAAEAELSNSDQEGKNPDCNKQHKINNEQQDDTSNPQVNTNDGGVTTEEEKLPSLSQDQEHNNFISAEVNYTQTLNLMQVSEKTLVPTTELANETVVNNAEIETDQTRSSDEILGDKLETNFVNETVTWPDPVDETFWGSNIIESELNSTPPPMQTSYAPPGPTPPPAPKQTPIPTPPPPPLVDQNRTYTPTPIPTPNPPISEETNDNNETDFKSFTVAQTEVPIDEGALDKIQEQDNITIFNESSDAVELPTVEEISGDNETNVTNSETEPTPEPNPGSIVKYLDQAKDGLLGAWNSTKGHCGKVKKWFSDILNERKYKVRDENGVQFFEDKEAVDEYCKEKNGNIEDFGNGFLCRYKDENGEEMQQIVEGYSHFWNTVKPVLCLFGAAAVVGLANKFISSGERAISSGDSATSSGDRVISSRYIVLSPEERKRLDAQFKKVEELIATTQKNFDAIYSNIIKFELEMFWIHAKSFFNRYLFAIVSWWKHLYWKHLYGSHLYWKYLYAGSSDLDLDLAECENQEMSENLVTQTGIEPVS